MCNPTVLSVGSCVAVHCGETMPVIGHVVAAWFASPNGLRKSAKRRAKAGAAFYVAMFRVAGHDLPARFSDG